MVVKAEDVKTRDEVEVLTSNIAERIVKLFDSPVETFKDYITSIIAALILLLLLGWVVMLLWNEVVPTIFEAPHLSYFQSVRLILLVAIFQRAYRIFDT